MVGATDSLPRDAKDYVERLRRLRSMLRLRSFESALMRQPKPGFQLLSRGEEAIAVGICAALDRTDPLLCSGRSIAIALARGVPAGGLLAELIGRHPEPAGWFCICGGFIGPNARGICDGCGI